MKTLLIACLLLAASTAAAYAPHAGIYWNPDEGGRGFAIDCQRGTCAVAAYVYDAVGNPIWYLAAGPLTNGRTLDAEFNEFAGGQCLGCDYQAPSVVGSGGRLVLTFTSDSTASAAVNGATIALERQDFGFPPGDAGMLGEWLFVFDIGSATLAQRYNFDRIESTPEGEIFADLPRIAGGRCRPDGFCAVADLNADGEFVAGFAFTRSVNILTGVFVSPATGREYPMTGWQTAPPGGALRRETGVTPQMVLEAIEALL